VLAGAAAGDAYPQAYRAVAEQDTERQLRGLRCPTLVFAGTEDSLFASVEPAYRMLADGQRAQIDGARTYVCERQSEQVAALLDRFFGSER
jgi:pimeloyl-ACP methyl ester carboxylesterase